MNLQSLHETTRASTILISCTIGAGILSLPFLFTQTHPLFSAINLIVAYAIILTASLFLGDLLQKLKKPHQMVGVARVFLSRRMGHFMIGAYFLYITGAILAYFIGSGEALAEVFPLFSARTWTTLFFLAGALILYFNLRVFSETEEFLTVFLIIFILGLIVYSTYHLSTGAFHELIERPIQPSTAFIPLGSIFFALMGIMAIPDMYNSFSEKYKKNISSAIIVAITSCVVLYVGFVLATLSIAGTENITEVASIGLGRALGRIAMPFINLFSVFAMFTSFLALAHSFKDSLYLDYLLPKKLSWILSVGIPFILFMSLNTSFGFVVSITGTIAGMLQITFILYMYYQFKGYAKRSTVDTDAIRPSYLRRKEKSHLPDWLTSKYAIISIMVCTLGIGMYSLVSLLL